LMMAQRTAKDPDDPSREYKWNHFNVIRVENGLIKEHWDDFLIN
jgi:predicted SnoaL-like aldol condensation-catalyzing enzyme